MAPAAGRGYGTRIITGTEGVIILPGGDGPDLRVLRAGSGAWEEPVLGTLDSLEARTREITALAEWASGEVAEHREDAHYAIVTQEILMAMYESARTHTLVRLPLRTRTSPLVETIKSGGLPVRYPGRYDTRHPGVSDETPEALPPRLQIRQRATIPRAR